MAMKNVIKLNSMIATTNLTSLNKLSSFLNNIINTSLVLVIKFYNMISLYRVVIMLLFKKDTIAFYGNMCFTPEFIPDLRVIQM